MGGSLRITVRGRTVERRQRGSEVGERVSEEYSDQQMQVQVEYVDGLYVAVFGAPYGVPAYQRDERGRASALVRFTRAIGDPFHLSVIRYEPEQQESLVNKAGFR